jgi:CRP-like cAMP-binding protein
VDIASPRTHAAGTTIVYAGDPGHTLYLIQRGTVDVLAEGPDGTESVVAELHGRESVQDSYAGSFFGEMSLLDVEPRSATVRAKTEVAVVAFPVRRLRELLQSDNELHLTVMTNIARILSHRLREANAR